MTLNTKGITQLEISIFLFFLSLCLLIFHKTVIHIEEYQENEFKIFAREWDKYRPRDIQKLTDK